MDYLFCPIALEHSKNLLTIIRQPFFNIELTKLVNMYKREPSAKVAEIDK